MKRIFLIGVLIVAPLIAKANDSSFEGVGGSARPTRGENKAIRMVREKVVLTANKNDFSTRAEFVFSNETGRAQSVSMGFPEGNFGDAASEGPLGKSTFIGFATFVDEKRFVAKRTALKKEDENGFDTYWVKTVPFAPHQTRRVRVEFRSPYGGTAEWGMTQALSYGFTGANWRGSVAESVLEVRITQPGLWRTVGFGSKQKPLAFSISSDKNGATLRRVWKNWQAQEDVTVSVERSTPFWRKDMTNVTRDSLLLKTVAATQTTRVGVKPKELEDSEGLSVEGFTYNGTFYVGVSYLEDKLDEWSEAQTPHFHVNRGFNASTGFDLRGGKLDIQGREGESVLRINGKTVAVGAPIISNLNNGSKMLYVPCAPLVRTLGWKLTMQGERLFSLQRGSWRG